jgi:hypothetical protein
MEPLPPILPQSNKRQPSYFLPQLPVLKPESTTTKLQVVFDGSAKRSSGLTLNDVLKVGATQPYT